MVATGSLRSGSSWLHTSRCQRDRPHRTHGGIRLREVARTGQSADPVARAAVRTASPGRVFRNARLVSPVHGAVLDRNWGATSAAPQASRLVGADTDPDDCRELRAVTALGL